MRESDGQPEEKECAQIADAECRDDKTEALYWRDPSSHLFRPGVAARFQRQDASRVIRDPEGDHARGDLPQRSQTGPAQASYQVGGRRAALRINMSDRGPQEDRFGKLSQVTRKPPHHTRIPDWRKPDSQNNSRI